MPVTFNRRQFLASSVAAGAALVAGRNVAIAAPEEGEWAFPVLGDLHFDRPEHHDMVWLEREHPGDVAQVRNYSQVTREVTPKLLDVVRQQATEAGVPVPFVIQLGDLVEGLCGSESLAGQQAEEALELVRAGGFPVPFLFTKGNHDIAGPGAPEVFMRTFVPFLADATDGEANGATYTRRRGGTLVVFYDAYDPGSLNWFEGVLAERKPERLLFVIHPPVVPYNARADWHVYSHPRQEEKRRRLLDLLGAARAVVLSGHLHKYSFLVRRTETGRFVQLAISSVATDPEARPHDLVEGVDRYGTGLLDLEPEFSPETVERRRNALEAERAFVERYEYARTWGHALVRVRGREMTAEVYRGLSREPWKRIDLTGPLG